MYMAARTWEGMRYVQHEAIRALGTTVWADGKRLFSQIWVEVDAVGTRLFLTSAYLFAIAWRHPPNCRQNEKKRRL